MSTWNAPPQRSAAVAYLLWFILGGFGVHRFYLGQTRSAVIMLALTVLGYITLPFVIGLLLLAVVAVWWIADAFLIPGLLQRTNGPGGFPAAPIDVRGPDEPPR